MDLAKYILGAWQLHCWRIEYGVTRSNPSEPQAVSYPFGQDASGFILYTPDGIMSASICEPGRPRLSQANVRNAPTSEQAEAFKSYFSYSGRWKVEGKNVIHTVELSLNPAFVGTDQIRQVDVLDDNRMQLSAQERIGADEFRNHILEWKRSSRAE